MSIADLAKDLNLSKSTVSRALNYYADVAPETRARVQQRAAEIGYIPNPVAQRLKVGRSDAVGVVLPPPLANGTYIEPFYSKMLGALVPELETAGLQLLVTTQQTTASDDDVNSYRRMVQRGLVDALLILRTRVNDPRVALAVQHDFPFVTYGRTDCQAPYAWVDVDHEQAIYMAVKRQISRGHRHIAFLNTQSHYNYARLRTEGYKRALEEAGLPLYPRWLAEAGLTEQEGFQAGSKLLAMQPRPTAIICTSDDMAIGVMAACRSHGFEPGKDMAIMGYGNSPATEYSSPPLTSIDASPECIGRQIGLFLQQRLQGKPADTMRYEQKVRIVERQSDPVMDID